VPDRRGLRRRRLLQRDRELPGKRLRRGRGPVCGPGV
jgi:hypothetical protein